MSKPIVIDWPLQSLVSVAPLQTLTGAGTLQLSSYPNTLSGVSMGRGLARTVSLTSTNNLSAVTFTIVAEDLFGNSLTVSRSGPNNNTVETVSLLPLHRILSVSASAAAAAVSVGTGTTGYTQWLTLNPNSRSFQCTIQGDVTGTINWSVFKTADQIQTFGVPSGNILNGQTFKYIPYGTSSLIQLTNVRLATVAALPANTYDNGTAGVGATLTANANGALSVDGVAVAETDRVLIKNEAAPANNGIYTVTATGASDAPYVLTRATDFDQAADIAIGKYVSITAGNTLINTTWMETGAGPWTMGTTAIVFTQFSYSFPVSSQYATTFIVDSELENETTSKSFNLTQPNMALYGVINSSDTTGALKLNILQQSYT